VFGTDGGDFFTFQVDPDMDVPTKIMGKKPIDGMQPWAYFVTGSAGNFDGFSATGEKWVVHGKRVDPKKLKRPGGRSSKGRSPNVAENNGNNGNDGDNGNDDDDSDDDAAYQQWHKKHRSAVIIVTPKKKK
jgi:hypothetical protein